MLLHFFLNKRFIVCVCVQTNKNKQGEGGQTYLYVHSVKKIALFFKQQIEFFLISCLAFAKSFLY